MSGAIPSLRVSSTWSSRWTLVDVQVVPGMNGCASRDDREVASVSAGSLSGDIVGASRYNIPGMKGGALMREWKTEGGRSERLSDEETIAARDGADGCSTPSPGM